MSARLPLAIVVAVARNGVIGRAGGLPWSVPEDLRHFRAVTMGHTILMGRRTWEGIGLPLPGRRTIVVTRGPAPAGAEGAPSLEEALLLARQTDDEPRIVGGAVLYAAALPLATRIFWTEIDQSPEGDTWFPSFDHTQWREVAARPSEGARFVELERAP